MSENEIMTITVLFYLGGFRIFKHFYIYYVQEYMKEEFPETVSYTISHMKLLHKIVSFDPILRYKINR